MKIAVHQMCSGIDGLINAHDMARAIAKSAIEGAQFYFAPEMSVMVDRDRKRGAGSIVTERESAPLKHIQAAAAEHQIWVHLGSMAILDEGGNGRFANRSILIDDHGIIRARYDKMHLFDVQLSTGENWTESSAYVAGKRPVIAKTPFGQIGLTICYDMRFPDLYSALSKAGVDILAVPSAFTVPTGSAHWHSLLRARAIESEAFVIAAAQSGKHADGRMTYGHSLVIDPWGEILLDMGDDAGLAFVDIDLTRIGDIRRQIPVHANRRDIPDVIFEG